MPAAEQNDRLDPYLKMESVKKLVFVVGCRGSGTTLIGHILGAHPNAALIDEPDGVYEWFDALSDMRADTPRIFRSVLSAAQSKYEDPGTRFTRDEALDAQRLSERVTHLVLRVPNLTSSYAEIFRLGIAASVVFPIRDPRAVVASMMRLGSIPMVESQIRWMRSDPALTEELADDIAQLESPSIPQHIKCALVWRIRSGLFDSFAGLGMFPYRLRYEDLVRNMELYCKQLADHVGLEHHDRMMSHEAEYVGSVPGLTDRTRAVDGSSAESPGDELDPSQQQDVLATGGELAVIHGYHGACTTAATVVKDLLATTIDAPLILLGRGGSGTRLLGETAVRSGVFLGNRSNPSYDSVEWAELIYALSIAKLNREVGKANAYPADARPFLRDQAVRMLRRGHWQEPTPWGWKLPETMFIVSDALAAFNRSKIVHLVRHPVTSSLRRTHMTARMDNAVGVAVLRAAYASIGLDEGEINEHEPHKHNAITWLYQIKSVCALCRDSLSSDRYLEVRYEDLCGKTDATARRIGDFLGISASAIRSPAVDAARIEQFDPHDPRIEPVWALCKEVALALGYDVAADGTLVTTTP